jgi:hypothetical protein
MSTACNPTILSRISNASAFNTWKTMTSNKIRGISPTAASGAIPPTDLEKSTLLAASSEVFDTAGCIQERLTTLGSTTNQIQTAQQDILRLNKEIVEAEADVAIARDRVAYIRHPEEHTSFYESWFPMSRPMQRENVPYFIGVTIFLFIFSLLVGLSLIGVNISVVLHPGFVYMIQRILAQFTWLTLILFMMLLFIIYYFVNQKQS